MNVGPKPQSILMMLGYWYGVPLVTDSKSRETQLTSLSDVLFHSNHVDTDLEWMGSRFVQLV